MRCRLHVDGPLLQVRSMGKVVTTSVQPVRINSGQRPVWRTTPLPSDRPRLYERPPSLSPAISPSANSRLSSVMPKNEDPPAPSLPHHLRFIETDNGSCVSKAARDHRKPLAQYTATAWGCARSCLLRSTPPPLEQPGSRTETVRTVPIFFTVD